MTRGLVEEAGIDAESGAILYRTSSYFLERMGLADLSELPDIAPMLPEIEDMDDDDSTESVQRPLTTSRSPSRGSTSDPATSDEPRRVEGVRLQKVLAQAGIASRRRCEQLMAEGHVEVNGEIVDPDGRTGRPRRPTSSGSTDAGCRLAPIMRTCCSTSRAVSSRRWPTSADART